MMGYYDRSGYGGMDYSNLVPGVAADLSTYPYASYHDETSDMIASVGHIADFYSGGYLASGDDAVPPSHNFNSLADFMGTSQDAVENYNGATTFWYFTDGSKLHYDNPGFAYPVPGKTFSYGDDSGMCGIYEYLDYSGYGTEVVDLYNQYTDNMGYAYGFTLADYMAEIDAGRVVMVHVSGHSMFGYGYDDQNPSTIYIHDTWSAGDHTMTWGGSYSGMDMLGVSVLQLQGASAPVPEPCTLALFAIAVLGAGICRVRRRSA